MANEKAIVACDHCGICFESNVDEFGDPLDLVCNECWTRLYDDIHDEDDPFYPTR